MLGSGHPSSLSRSLRRSINDAQPDTLFDSPFLCTFTLAVYVGGDEDVEDVVDEVRQALPGAAAVCSGPAARAQSEGRGAT